MFHRVCVAQVRFDRAIELVGSDFVDVLNYLHQCWLPDRQTVEQAMKTREAVDSSATILLLEQPCAWKPHIRVIEQEEQAQTVYYPLPDRLATCRFDPMKSSPPKVLFVVYPGDSDRWNVQSVPKDDRFKYR